MQNRNRFTDMENKFMVSKEIIGERERQINWKYGINRYKLLYIKQIVKWNHSVVSNSLQPHGL